VLRFGDAYRDLSRILETFDHDVDRSRRDLM
jgi:hypothetical protein